jgi:isoquinoline 1-oxidoreductase beta subunit
MAFVYQSFMDEVAEAAGIDLPELRRTLGAPRELPVVPGRPIMHSGRARRYRWRVQNGQLARRQTGPRRQG